MSQKTEQAKRLINANEQELTAGAELPEVKCPGAYQNVRFPDRGRLHDAFQNGMREAKDFVRGLAEDLNEALLGRILPTDKLDKLENAPLKKDDIKELLTSKHSVEKGYAGHIRGRLDATTDEFEEIRESWEERPGKESQDAGRR